MWRILGGQESLNEVTKELGKGARLLGAKYDNELLDEITVFIEKCTDITPKVLAEAFAKVAKDPPEKYYKLSAPMVINIVNNNKRKLY